MTDSQKLNQLSVEDLLQELRSREVGPGESGIAKSTESSEHLREFDDATLIQALKANQKVIYGTDDRVDVYQLSPGSNLDDVDCVVALFNSASVVDNGNGTSTLQTRNFGTALNLCPTERFREQPSGAFCSGFLVAPDVIATAGHCVDASSVTNVRFVFGFRMVDATTAQTVINNSELYRGVSVIGRQLVGNGADWCLVKLDRPVSNHRIAQIRVSGRISNSQSVHVIGHPSGLPTKFAGNAVVRDNQPSAFFVANLDTYGGNSGSPVFNSDTHEVEGILVRGETDFTQQGNCNVSLVCPTTGCRGEDCTRTTEFASLLSSPRAEFYTTDGNGNLALLRQHTGWRQSWRQILPGNFGGSSRTDLLFYDPSVGEGEFYTTDDGNISLLRQHTGWRRSWNLIVPGNFGGSSRTDLLFYDSSVGEGEFYTTDAGNISLLSKHTGWRRSWNLIIPGNFGGSSRTDLLFYDPTTGEGEFYTTDGGSISLLSKYTGWRRSWNLIIPGNFGGSSRTDLLFYDPTTGEGEFYTTDGGGISLLKKHTGWRRSWSLIIPGNFGGSSRTDLLFYDPTTGEGEFYATDGNGNISLLKQNSGWRRSWSLIIPGDFGGSTSTDLLFYDPSASS